MQPINEGMVDIGYGNIKAFLPKENTREAWETLKAVVDAYIKSLSPDS